jgi:superoxide dismutase
MDTPISSLPDLPYDPAALEPHVSGRIMELDHGRSPRSGSAVSRFCTTAA